MSTEPITKPTTVSTFAGYDAYPPEYAAIAHEHEARILATLGANPLYQLELPATVRAYRGMALALLGALRTAPPDTACEPFALAYVRDRCEKEASVLLDNAVSRVNLSARIQLADWRDALERMQHRTRTATTHAQWLATEATRQQQIADGVAVGEAASAERIAKAEAEHARQMAERQKLDLIRAAKREGKPYVHLLGDYDQ